MASAAVSLVPVQQVILRLRNERCSSLDTSASSTGSRRSSISTRVTSVPKEVNIEENSVPTAPAPSTTMLFGTRPIFKMWSELRMRSPSVLATGISRGTEPVAITTFRVA